MSLSGYHDWEADKWEFVYDLPTNPSESTGEISPVGPERQSPLAGLADFGVSLVRGIFEFIRDALSGVVQAGAAIIGPLVDGAISLLGGAFDFIGNLFFGWNGREKKPLPPIYSDVFTDIEAATQPFFDVVDKNLEDIELLSGELDNARAELDSKLDVVTEDIRAAELALEAVGDVDKKIADQALIHTQEAATALQEARDAMDALTSYQSSNDAEIQALKQQAQEALRQAGDALTEYDTLWEDHEALKTEATGSIDALKQLTQKHNYSLGTIESDLPGMKASITTAQAKADAAVVGTKVEYAVGTSETAAPTSGWSASTPTRTPGHFVWMRSIITYGSGSTTTTSPVLVTGNTGAKGTDGVAGKDGVGLESTVVMYAVSSNGTTPPASGWQVAVPTLTQGNYLWTRTVWAYSDGSTEAGHSVAYLAKDGSDGTDGLPGKDGVGIVDTVITYAASSSGTTPPSSGWVASPPAGAPGQFIWTRTVWHYSDSTSETGYSVGKIGNTGAKGDPGKDGIPGKDGVGLRTTTVTYALSTSGTTAPSTGWSSAVPTLVKGRYLWTRTVWEYSDSTSETGYSVSYVPTDGTNGNDGLPGKDGVSITSTTITYAKSTSGTTPPSSGWSSQPPATAPGDFVWTRTVWSYSDNTSETGYSIGKIGNTGAKGDRGIQGVPGPKGEDGATTYTWIKYADSASGAGLSDSPVGKTYIGFAYNQTTATESTVASDYTWALIQGPQGNQGVPGPKGADGQTTYTWVKYSDNASGSGLYDVPKASTKYIGIAVNKTTATESSTPSDYTWSLFRGEDGVGVSSTAIAYTSSTSGTTTPTSGWQSTVPSVAAGSFLWTRTITTYTDGSSSTSYSTARQGVNGANGSPGAKGADGKTSYFHVAYADNATGTAGFSTTDAANKLYVGTYSDFTEADSTDPKKYTWQLVKGADGSPGKGVQSSVVTYQSSTSGTVTPTGTWSSTIPTVAQGSVLWTRTVTTFTDGATTTAYSVSRQGVDGARGPQGVAGPKGADGVTTYTWIKYADSASGAGLANDPAGKTYIGFAYNKTTATESTNPADYTWSLIKGEKGDQGNQGIPGPKGADGQPTYTWVKYSDVASGASPYDVPKASTRYIGIAVNKTTQTESSNPADYAWSQFRGEDGRGVSSTAVTYASSASGTTTPSSWSSTIPTVAAGSFLWTRTVITYTDSTTSTAYSIARQGANGANGSPGAKGADGKTSYLHVAYAGNSTGTSNFSTTDPTGREWVGTYTDFTEADSTDPSKYTWQLVKGADGQNGKGVQSATVTYAGSTSGTTIPTTGWQSTIPTVAQGRFLWTRTVTTFTDGATSTAYINARQGANGSDGISVTAVVPYYQLVNKGASAPAKPTTASPSGWTTTEPSFEAGKELYRSDRVTYSSGNTSWTDVSKVSAYTAADVVNDKAEEALKGVNDGIYSGDSLVAYLPGSDVPVWADKMDKASASENPDGIPEAYVFSSFSSTVPVTRWISVVPSREYRVSVWLKADKPGSRIYLELRDQDGSHAVRTGSIGGGGTYIIGNMELPTKWTKYESTIVLREAADRVRIATRYQNHANGSVRDAVQYMANLRIDPANATQGQVQEALSKTEAINKALTGTVNGDLSAAINNANTAIGAIKASANKAENWTTANDADFRKAVSLFTAAQGKVNDINKIAWLSQTEWNAEKGKIDDAQTKAILANAKINDSQDGLIAANNKAIRAQNTALTAQQRILDMAYPGASLVGHYDEPFNFGTEAEPDLRKRPFWAGVATPMKGGAGDPELYWRFPDVTTISTSAWYVNLTSSEDQAVEASPGGRYRIKFQIRTSALSSVQLGVLPASGSLTGAVVSWEGKDGIVTDGPVSGASLSGEINTEGSWRSVEVEFSLSETVDRVKFYALSYHATNTTVVSDIADLEVFPIIPSQMKVNEGFANAIEANTKAIRLAFPDLNLDPKGTNGHPMWTSRSTVTIINSGNPGGRDPAYRIAGSAGAGAGFMDLQPDLREYRIRGWVTPGSGTSPRLTIMVINQSGTSVIEAWRPTFPADKDSTSKEDSLKDYDEVQWTSGSSVALTPANGMLGSPGEWSELDIVVRLKAGETSVRLALATPTTTNNWVLVNDIRFTTLNPSQWKTDYAQNRALTGLKESFRAQQTINTTQDELNSKLADSQQSLLASLRELQGAVWRVFPVQDVTYNSATELSTHIQVRKGSSSWVYVDARGSTWSGDMIITGYYDAGPPFVRVVKVTPGLTGRTNGVPRTQSHGGTQQLREVRIDFRVDPERIVATKVLENFDPGKSSVLRSDLEFDPNKTAATAPNNGADGVFTDAEAKSPVLHYIDWEVVWDATTASDSYLMEVGVVPSGGTTMNSLKFLRVDGPGPTFPWQNGRRTTTINVSANLSRGDKLVFAIWSGAGQSSQRKVAKTTRTVSWMKP